MVKWSNQPLQASLLKLESGERAASSHGKLESGEMNRQALDCFLSIQRYMGDQPMAKDMAEVDCVYTILMVSGRTRVRDPVVSEGSNAGIRTTIVLDNMESKFLHAAFLHALAHCFAADVKIRKLF